MQAKLRLHAAPATFVSLAPILTLRTTDKRPALRAETRAAFASAALALALVATLVLGATAASAGNASYHPRFRAAPCPNSPVPLPDGTRCGYVTVPENRAHPFRRHIHLAVATVPAAAKHPDPSPIVYLTGGPGGIAFFEAKRDVVAGGLNRRHDVILVEQRGTYFSDPTLGCPVIDAFNGQLPSLRYDTASTRRKHVTATRKCHRSLARKGYD